jgi:arsenate reductase-like glutaredoxin family protein
VKAAGGVEAVLNTRHAIAKREGWKETTPTLAKFIEGVAEHENVIRRPILVKNGSAVVGKDEAAVRALLGG